MQLFVIVVGPTLLDIEASYVAVDDVLYKVATPLKAVDLCFKIFHALNAQYPIESHGAWFFLQTAVYGIKTVYDRESPSVRAIISSMGQS